MATGGKPKTISHPLCIQGLFEVYEEIEVNLPTGTNYGFLHSMAAISCNSITGDKNKNFAVRLSGYTGRNKNLVQDRIYFVTGRLLAMNSKVEPMLIYNSELTAMIGTTLHMQIDMIDKVIVSGLGWIVSREEVFDKGQEKPTLVCRIEHTDWDSVNRKQVSFEAIYRVPPTRVMSNAQALFRVGREVLVNGTIVDWDKKTSSFVIEVYGVSTTAGDRDSGKVKEGNVQKGEKKLGGGGKRVLTAYDSDSSESNLGKADVSAATDKTIEPEENIKKERGLESEMREVGEIVELGDVKESDKNKKRSRFDVIADGKKRMKAM